MKWLVRIFAAIALLLLLAMLGAWLLFPSYAPALLERLTEETGMSIELREPGRPGLSGVSFG